MVDTGTWGAGGALSDYSRTGRNARDWQYWQSEPLAARPGETDHYAVYPAAIPAFAIRAGTSEWGCCPACGSPWARVVERVPGEAGTQTGEKRIPGGYTATSTLSYHGNGSAEWVERGPKTTTLGWRPTCRCPAHAPVPCRVLDPFAGSGTTLLAANRLGRDATGIELKPQYVALAKRRVAREPLSLFATHGESAEAAEAAVTAVGG
jgi:hypothetical protein